MIKSYRDLDVWQKSMDAAVVVYQITKSFPADERFGLINQVRRAVASIPANIAEGHGRLHKLDYVRFLSIARGSLMEVETHLQLALRLEYITRDQLKPIWSGLQEVGRLLNGLIRSLRGTTGGETGSGIAHKQLVREQDVFYLVDEASNGDDSFDTIFPDPRPLIPDPSAQTD